MKSAVEVARGFVGERGTDNPQYPTQTVSPDMALVQTRQFLRNPLLARRQMVRPPPIASK